MGMGMGMAYGMCQGVRLTGLVRGREATAKLLSMGSIGRRKSCT